MWRPVGAAAVFFAARLACHGGHCQCEIIFLGIKRHRQQNDGLPFLRPAGALHGSNGRGGVTLAHPLEVEGCYGFITDSQSHESVAPGHSGGRFKLYLRGCKCRKCSQRETKAAKKKTPETKAA
jgi:hypothetical protein